MTIWNLNYTQEILAGLSKTHELPIALCEWIDMRREYGAFIAQVRNCFYLMCARANYLCQHRLQTFLRVKPPRTMRWECLQGRALGDILILLCTHLRS